MKLQRFFCEEKLGGMSKIVIPRASLVNQLKNVFRLKTGSEVLLFDNSGHDYNALIDEYGKDTVSLSIIKENENRVLPTQETYLFASLVKKDNFEWILEKATELGVSHIIPIISNRTEKKDLNIDRAHKIIIEASEQSGRATIPILHDVSDLEVTLNKFAHVKSIAWHTHAPKFVSQDLTDTIGAYIGPEGGWSTDEEELFNKYNIRMRSLGPQVLRSETAVIAVLSRFVF